MQPLTESKLSEYGVAYFLYTLHVSRSHVRVSSVVSALYLLLLKLVTRRYVELPPLIKAAFKDSPYDDKAEGYLVGAALQCEYVK